MRLYLIRHAESANNAFFAGSKEFPYRVPDPEITTTGHEQAQHLAGFLCEPGNEPCRLPEQPGSDINFDLTHLYCSLMTRALLTAGYIAQHSGVTLTAELEVFERKGLFDTGPNNSEQGINGPNRDYFTERFPGVALPDTLNDKGWWSRPVENNEQFIGRVSRSIDGIVARHRATPDRVALVVHGDYIDQCLNHLMGVVPGSEITDEHWTPNWALHNTSITRIDFTESHRTLVYVNRTDHLPQQLVTW